MELVDNTKKVDEKLVEKLTKSFEKAEASFKDKKFMIELTKEQVKFYTEKFLPGVTWKGYECYAVAELSKSFKETFAKKTTALWNREHVEATFHFIKTFEGTGSIELAEQFKDFCDAFAKPMQDIQTEIQELKDLATELQAAEQGVTVEQLIQGSTTQGPQ